MISQLDEEDSCLTMKYGDHTHAIRSNHVTPVGVTRTCTDVVRMHAVYYWSVSHCLVV
jgi:hypothetical protein